MPDAEDLGFELLPADDEQIDAEAALDAAEAGALEDPFQLAGEEGDPAPEPFGRSWSFDWARGRFNRAGAGPAEVHGDAALWQKCMMALHSARGAHPIFSQDFGLDRAAEHLGEAPEPGEIEADYGEAIRAALTYFDRVADVEDYSATYSQDDGVLYVNGFTIVKDTDEPEADLRVGPVEVDTVPPDA